MSKGMPQPLEELQESLNQAFKATLAQSAGSETPTKHELLSRLALEVHAASERSPQSPQLFERESLRSPARHGSPRMVPSTVQSTPDLSAFERVEVYEGKASGARELLGAINLGAVRTVEQARTPLLPHPSRPPPPLLLRPAVWRQVRDLLRTTLGVERLPTPGFEFFLAGRPLLQAQEEEWPAVALREGIVLRRSDDARHRTVPPRRRLEVWVGGEPVSLGELEVSADAMVDAVRREVRQRFGSLAPAEYLLLDRRQWLIARADEAATAAAELGPFAVLHRPVLHRPTEPSASASGPSLGTAGGSTAPDDPAGSNPNPNPNPNPNANPTPTADAAEAAEAAEAAAATSVGAAGGHAPPKT